MAEYSPVLVSPPATRIVSAVEAMRQCRITLDPDDAEQVAEVTALLEAYIDSATAHLDGYTGIMGRALLKQTWRQDYDSFAKALRLKLGPLSSDGPTLVEWVNSAGVAHPVDPSFYRVFSNAGGMPHIRFSDSFIFPSDLDEAAAVRVTYEAGENVAPPPIKQAILLIVGAWYENREEAAIGVSVDSLPASIAVRRLIFPYRIVDF